jgi:hypothetical protein
MELVVAMVGMVGIKRAWWWLVFKRCGPWAAKVVTTGFHAPLEKG